MIINKFTGWGVEDITKDRGTGRSTALALQYISEALRNPSSEVKIIDRDWARVWGEKRQANVLLFKLTREIVEKLGLKYLVFNRHKLSITYDLYGEEEAPDVVLCEGRLFGKVGSRDMKIFDGREYKSL